MKANKQFILWLTGLSASGKTTLAQVLNQEFINQGIDSHHLDGDEVRTASPIQLGFSKEDRDRNIELAIEVAKRHQDNGKIVIASFITPYRVHRDWGRERLVNYIEVFINCPLHICEERDPKGLYKKARAGDVELFTGIDDPYEEPEKADIDIPTHQYTPEESKQKIFSYLRENGFIF